VGGGDSTQQTQSQNSSSTSNPYGPTQGLLQNIISQLGSQSTTPTGGQTTAAGNLTTAANGIPDLSKSITGVTTGALSGDPTGMLNSGYNTLNSNIGGIASGSTDPMSNPAMRGWLDTISGDASNATNGAFAAAGRDFSPANSQATARGIAQGEAPVLANQYNTNVGNKLSAANSLYGAGNTTAGNIANNQQTGLNDAGALPGLLTQPAQTQLNAANTQAQLPLSTIQQLEQLGIPLASVGGTTTSSGTGTGTTTKQTSATSNIIGGLLGAASLASKFPIPSDERLKENIATVGMLNDGLPVYSYNYKGDETPRIGLMAQDVEKVTPNAVSDIGGGYKGVDYGRATAKSRHIGGLLDLKAAA
jgi:hypothetical protein